MFVVVFLFCLTFVEWFWYPNAINENEMSLETGQWGWFERREMLSSTGYDKAWFLLRLKIIDSISNVTSYNKYLGSNKSDYRI